jgi:hypothetical protein
VTDDELRTLVKAAVARHLGGHAETPGTDLRTLAPSDPRTSWRQHASHYQYVTVVNVGDACVIEPGVECNHCGYCKSHGH